MTIWVAGAAAALVLGAVGGALAEHLRQRTSSSAAPNGQQPAPEPPSARFREIRPADAARDWAHAERGRPWASRDPGSAQAPTDKATPSDLGETDGSTPWQAGSTAPQADVERAAAEQAVAERARLVEACADLADRLRDHQPALYAVLRKDLEGVGVSVQLADGETLDTARHNPVGTEPTSDPGQHLSVAATMRLGYLDHGVVVRQPDVIVYRFGATAHAG